MEIPEPQPGLVIRYAYLWRSEAAKGREEGVKDRPCAVVLATKRDGDRMVVVVAPITHSPPEGAGHALELPAETKRRLGLDDDRSWIVTNDLNVFIWPRPDIRPVKSGGNFSYGFLPHNLTKKLIERVRDEVRLGRKNIVSRSE